MTASSPTPGRVAWFVLKPNSGQISALVSGDLDEGLGIGSAAVQAWLSALTNKIR